jgi:hypothetical protein
MISTEDFYLSCNASIAGAQNKKTGIIPRKIKGSMPCFPELMV